MTNRYWFHIWTVIVWHLMLLPVPSFRLLLYFLIYIGHTTYWNNIFFSTNSLVLINVETQHKTCTGYLKRCFSANTSIINVNNESSCFFASKMTTIQVQNGESNLCHTYHVWNTDNFNWKFSDMIERFGWKYDNHSISPYQ